MVKGPFKDWDEAVAECCTRLGLMIVQHDWKDDELWVATVPQPERKR